MAKRNLIIVESPAKARTIAKFLGSGYAMESSFGHIRDLPKKDLAVDVAKNFEPTYQVSPDKKEVVAKLKKAAADSTVWLATDEDREGEAIAWHICYVLGLDPAKTNRIVFHEITEPAIKNALANPRTIDIKMVDSQQARRILDRLVGYELSPVLWKKVQAGLSAGRVQSVAVRLIVDRERQIKSFEPQASFKVTAVFEASSTQLEAELKQKIDDKKAAQEFLEALLNASFKIEAIDQKPGTRSPSAPFTTSTLQQEAARRLGFSVRQTMSLAQRLYENGHITYMRTDSLNLSEIALSGAKDYVTKNYGAKYYHRRQYKTKSAGAQEAHEAIRPTNLDHLSAGTEEAQKKLYGLIWRRTVASQMAPAALQKTDITIGISGRPEKFIASGEVLTFDGFLKAYGGAKEDRILPVMQIGQSLDLTSAKASQTFSRAPARYSEAALVRKLEELGIGRPSTYAPTISVIQDRGYIEKKDVDGELKPIDTLLIEKGQVVDKPEQVVVGADRNKLLPTALAEIVTDFLVKHFKSIVDYDFTAKAEAEFDDIASGKIAWQDVLRHFYSLFHPMVEESEKVSRSEAAQARELGVHPKKGEPIIVRWGRFGPVLQMGDSEDKSQKVAFAPLPAGADMKTVTLEQALPMFNLPRVVGKTEEGEEITANIGRFGPYINVGKLYVSLKETDPLTIEEAEARTLINDKVTEQKEKLITDFGKIKILRGPYGPYITDGKRNARVPKEVEPETIKEAEAKVLLDKAPTRKWRGRRKSKPSPKS